MKLFLSALIAAVAAAATAPSVAEAQTPPKPSWDQSFSAHILHEWHHHEERTFSVGFGLFSVVLGGLKG